MSKREKVIAVITALVFLFWLRHITSPAPKKRSSPAKATTRARTAPQAISVKSDAAKQESVPDFDWQSVVDGFNRKIEEADIPLSRDPFDKLDYRSVFTSTALEFSELSLSGIIWEESAPLALINNQILAPGEMISGFKVQEIRQNEVILIKGTEKFIMRLYNLQNME